MKSNFKIFAIAFLNVAAFLIFFLDVKEVSAQGGAKWGVNGNSINAGDFLGTSNNRPLIIKTNDAERLRIRNSGELLISNLAEYAADYSALFTARSLVDRGWVESRGYLTGNQPITLSGDVSGSGTISIPSTVNWANGHPIHDARYLKLGGGTLTGSLTLNADPTNPLEASTKQYVDTKVAGSSQWSTNGSNIFYNTGKVGVGINNPQATVEIRGNIIAVDEAGISGNRGFVAYQNNNGTQGALFSGYKSRGTHAAPTSVQNGDFGFAYANTLRGSSAYINSGALVFSVDGPVSGNSIPSQVEFITSSTGNEGLSNYGQTRMIIKSDGKIGIGTKIPSEKFQVAGTIYSSTGGFKFPDGSVQITASISQPAIFTPGTGTNSAMNNLAGDNYVYGPSSLIAAGSLNTIFGGGENSFIGSGHSNGLIGLYSAILSGEFNSLADDHSVILGGFQNFIGSPITVGGSGGDPFASSYNFISGGINNWIQAGTDHCSVIGGSYNRIPTGLSNVVILGGNSIEATQSNTTYAPNMTITGLAGTGNRMLMVDSNGALTTGGSVGSGTILDSIHIAHRIKVGNSIIIDGLSNSNPTNHIYTDASAPTDLLIQSNPAFNHKTIINANNTGHVHIGNPVTTNGEPSPIVKLEVRGSISLYDGQGGGTDPNNTGDNSVFFGREQSSLTNGSEKFGEWGVQYWNGLAKQAGTGGDNTWGGLNFWKPFGSTGTTGNAFLFLQNDGNVGIGTPNPIAKLDVAGNGYFSGPVAINTSSRTNPFPAGYQLAVLGNVIAEEYVVKLRQDWPDYVFKKGYKLKSLNELDEYVKENNHLPGIPSAKEVENEGVSVGDMLNKQMQKIEELSLYLIELNKKVEVLQAENETLKGAIKK